MASPNLSEIITTTLRNRSGELTDNVSKGNALLMRLKEKGAWKPASGRTIVQELDYAENGSFMYYSGGEQLNIASSDVMTGAEFDWKQAACVVVATGLEVDVQNTGKEQIIDLMEGRISVAEGQLQNRMDYDLYQDGTGNASKNITGLAAAVPDTPTSGTYGGIYGFNSQSGAQKFFLSLDQVDQWTPAILDGKVYSFVNSTFRNHHPETGGFGSEAGIAAADHIAGPRGGHRHAAAAWRNCAAA